MKNRKNKHMILDEHYNTQQDIPDADLSNGNSIEKILIYIQNDNVEQLKSLLTSSTSLINYVCPNNGHNLLGISILKRAPITIIKILIEFGVDINGTWCHHIPLKTIPFVMAYPEQIDAAYELIKAGAKYDFYECDTRLWLDVCQECNKKLFKKIIQAIEDRASQLGEFTEPSIELLLNQQYQQIFSNAKITATARKIELRKQQEEFIELKQKILAAKELAEKQLLDGTFYSISMQISDLDGMVDFSATQTSRIDVKENLKMLFKHSKENFKAAKKAVKEDPYDRLCRALGDNVEHPCSTKALAKRDMLIAGLGHLPRLKFAALSKVSA